MKPAKPLPQDSMTQSTHIERRLRILIRHPFLLKHPEGSRPLQCRNLRQCRKHTAGSRDRKIAPGKKSERKFPVAGSVPQSAKRTFPATEARYPRPGEQAESKSRCTA